MENFYDFTHKLMTVNILILLWKYVDKFVLKTLTFLNFGLNFA